MRLHSFLLSCLLLLLPFGVRAERWTAETLPMVHLQDARRYVCNPDGVLSTAAVDSIDKMLTGLEKDKGVESVVVVVERVKGGDPYEFGMALGKKYGVGSKTRRTGLIVVLAVKDRKYHILTGHGLEGTLPDALCKRIENRILVPFLKKGDWNGGMIATVSALNRTIRGDKTLLPDNEEEDDELAAVLGLCIALFFIGGTVVLVIVGNERNKCPKCKHAQMRIVKKQRVRVDGQRRWLLQVTYRCPRCGHEKVAYVEDENDFETALATSILLGGMAGRRGGGGFGSGGFSGGSFGGGSFGGGGAGGSF